MVWRSVVISKPTRLRRDRHSLVIDQEQSARVPFEDIAVIVLNHREITLTHPVLSACGEYGIGLFATDDTHHPSGVFLPFLSHSRATRMQRLQLDVDRPRVKRTWARIVRAKIGNQARCLQLLGRDTGVHLFAYAERVRSGDRENMEAKASAYYFPELFDRNFHRAQDRWCNGALNYGYAVLRGAIARGLVAHGFLPSIGLFHRSEQNAFNLADDLIEPFRPVVDLHVARQYNADDVGKELKPMDKAALVALLNVDVGMPRGTMSVLSAIEHSIESLVRIHEGADDTAMELPILNGLGQHVVDG